MAKIFLVFLLAFLLLSCNNTLQMGRYVTNFTTYGMFGTSVELNCDSTFVKRFTGDMMDDRSYGKWSVSGDTVILTYDTIIGQRYSGTEHYIYSKKKLKNTVNKQAQQKLVQMLDTMPMPAGKKKEIVRQMRRGGTPKNFNGSTGYQYLKLVEKKKCR